MDLKKMKQAGEELNSIVELNVPINLEVDDKELLTLDIEEVAAMLEKGDEISSETAETIKELGFDIPKGVVIKEKIKKIHETIKRVEKTEKKINKEMKKELNLGPLGHPSPEIFEEEFFVDEEVIDSRFKKKVKKSSKRPGVVKAIISFIDEFGPITKDEILQKLVEEFPARKESAMKKTISAWLPNGFNKRKGMNIIKTEEGFINKGV